MMDSKEKVKEFNDMYPLGSAGLTNVDHLKMMCLMMNLYRVIKEKLPLKDPIEVMHNVVKVDNDYHYKLLESTMIVVMSMCDTFDLEPVDDFGCTKADQMANAIKEIVTKALPF